MAVNSLTDWLSRMEFLKERYHSAESRYFVGPFCGITNAVPLFRYIACLNLMLIDTK